MTYLPLARKVVVVLVLTMASLAIPQSLVNKFTGSMSKISRERPLLFILSLAGVVSSASWVIWDVSVPSKFQVIVLKLCLLSTLQYRSFIALGKGGVPHNLFGWMAVTLFLRPLSRSQKKITDTSELDQVVQKIANEEGNGAIFKKLSLPQRRGERPNVMGIIPQRQLDNSGSADLIAV